jgi:hypothetical protein
VLLLKLIIKGAEPVFRLVLTLNSVCVSIHHLPLISLFPALFSPKTRIVDRNTSEGPSCRCEYPGEDYYGDKFDDYVTVDNVKILPLSYEACQDVSFVCPGEEADGSVVWSYDCSELAEEGEHRRAQLRGQRSLKAIKRHEYSSLVTVLRSPQVVVLPSEHDDCAPSISCTDKKLTFDKASDGRPLVGGSLIQNEFLHNYGVKITAQSQSDSKTVQPMLFDTENAELNGIEIPEIYSLGSPNVDCATEASGIGDGGQPGRSGDNCEPLGNVLIAKKVGPPTEEDQYGVLTFEFDDKVEVFYEIGLLNILGSDSSVEFYQEDGSTTTKLLVSVGQNGLLIVPSNLRNVTKIVVDMRSFSAVTHLKFCWNGP